MSDNAPLPLSPEDDARLLAVCELAPRSQDRRAALAVRLHLRLGLELRQVALFLDTMTAHVEAAVAAYREGGVPRIARYDGPW